MNQRPTGLLIPTDFQAAQRFRTVSKDGKTQWKGGKGERGERRHVMPLFSRSQCLRVEKLVCPLIACPEPYTNGEDWICRFVGVVNENHAI